MSFVVSPLDRKMASYLVVVVVLVDVVAVGEIE